LPPICQPEGPSEAEVRVEALTASARAKAAAVTLAAVELVDAAAALLAVEDELGTTWRQWFGWQCGLTRTETQQVCSLATRLPELPLIDAAFRSGEISLGVTAELVSVATADNEAALLDTTRSATGAQLGVLLRDYRRARRDARRRLLPEEDPAVAPSTVVAGWARVSDLLCRRRYTVRQAEPASGGKRYGRDPQGAVGRAPR